MSERVGTQHDELRELQQRLVLFKISLLLVVGLLTLRLWYLQVSEGSYYHDLSENNRTRAVVLEPVRGLIYDRNGVLLANNVPSFGLYVTLEDVKDRTALIESLVKMVGLDEATVRKKLSERGSKLLPRKVKDGLTLREAAVIESHRLDLPGMTVRAESQRNYPSGLTAAHLLGYVGEVSSDQLEKPEYAELHLGSIIGQYGVEKTYDRFLRGRAGQKTVEVDAMGHEKRTVEVSKPSAGDDLYLTVDARLQTLAEQLLGDESGAIIAIETTTGDVLALASRPVFDPNVLSRELTAKQWDRIVQDEGHPLTNRATQGQYPPGSTFKIIVAAAGLETGTVNTTTKVRCMGGYPFGGRVYRDWKAGGHGVMDVMDAIVDSCDVFFYTLGQRLGIDTMAEYADRFGLGHETGIELPSERTGIVPSTAWKTKARNEIWMPGETISAAIGQGYTTVTPMQMAMVMATVAGSGESFRPRIVRAIKERATGQVLDLPSVPRRKLALKPETYELLHESLEGVVTRGTAGRARSALVRIAGKTGTAQTAALKEDRRKGEDVPKKLRDHAWFVSYAPAEEPRIAVAVLVENMGHGGSWAAPMAKQVIEAYIKSKSAEPVTAKAGLDQGQAPMAVAMRGVHD
jgi:penicillin-binding protein 2